MPLIEPEGSLHYIQEPANEAELYPQSNKSNPHTHTLFLFKVNQSHYRTEVPRGFQEVKVPRLRDNGPEWW